jgi:hypothetical protein
LQQSRRNSEMQLTQNSSCLCFVQLDTFSSNTARPCSHVLLFLARFGLLCTMSTRVLAHFPRPQKTAVAVNLRGPFLAWMKGTSSSVNVHGCVGWKVGQNWGIQQILGSGRGRGIRHAARTRIDIDSPFRHHGHLAQLDVSMLGAHSGFH